MRRRRFLQFFGLAMASAPAPLLSAQQLPAPQAPVPSAAGEADRTALSIQPYLQNPTADAITIMWRTAAPAYGWVEYGETEKLGQKQDLVIDGLRAANTEYHRVRLTGLGAGKTYYYRIGYRVIDSINATNTVTEEPRHSPVSQFRLPAPGQEKVSCYILNDLHNVYPSFEHVKPLLGKLTPDCIFFNGDCFENPASEVKVIKAFQVYNPGINAGRFPVFYLRGNHETCGAYARQLKRHFENPDDRFYFAYTLGPVRFIVLDMGDSKPDSHESYAGLTDFSGYRKAQAAWLASELKSEAFEKAKYHVLVHHIPLYWRENQHPADPAPWESILKNAPIDAAICGHLHQPVIFKKGEVGNPYPVVVGGGRRHKKVITLDADTHHCRINLLDRDGKLMDKMEIK